MNMNDIRLAFLSILLYSELQLDEVVPHNGSFQLGDLNEEQEKEETKTVTAQEPEIHKTEYEANSNTEAKLRHKKDERYSLIGPAVKKH